MGRESRPILGWTLVLQAVSLSLITATYAQSGGGSYGVHDFEIDPTLHDQQWFTFRSIRYL